MGEREIAIKYFLDKCSEKYSDKLIKSVPFNCKDRGEENENKKQYSMCYNKNNPNLEKYCGPDWVFYHWASANISSFEDTSKKIIIESIKEPTINKVGWYGNINSPLSDVVEYRTRPLLKQIGDLHSHLFDIVHIHPGGINPNNKNYVSLPDLVKYKYLLDIGGNGYSGRLKFLFFSKRPILLVDRDYIEYFNNELIPYTHYIPVKMDLSDLLGQVKWMDNNYEKSLEIANNAFEYATNNFTLDKILERVYYVYKNIEC